MIIVATDKGIIHKMKMLSPERHSSRRPPLAKRQPARAAHTAVDGYERSGHLAEVLETSGKNEVHVDPEIARRARRSIQRMLDFAQGLNLKCGAEATWQRKNRCSRASARLELPN